MSRLEMATSAGQGRFRALVIMATHNKPCSCSSFPPETTRAGLDCRVALSVELGVSAFHLCRVLREQCGLSMHAYRQRQRLCRAIELMQSSRQDLTRVAHKLG